MAGLGLASLESLPEVRSLTQKFLKRKTMDRKSIVAVALVLMCTFSGITNLEAKPLKVFILVGQSNMQGHAQIQTMDVMEIDAATAPMLKDLRNADGSPVICDDVWISSIGSSEAEKVGKLTAGFGAEFRNPKIGPEFSFGIYMHKILQEPILIIKTAWGGKSINTDFRPPSAGPYVFNQSQLDNFTKQNKDVAEQQKLKDEATGVYYRLMLDHVKTVLSDIQRVYPNYDAKQGYELAGLVWFQGWNDMVDRGTYPNRDQEGGYDAYSQVMAHFIRDVRRELSAPKLPVVIGVLGVGGPTDKYTEQEQRYQSVHNNFRMAMAAPADIEEFKGNVAAVWTDQYWDMELKQLRREDSEVQAELKKKAEAEGLSRAELQSLIEKNRAERLNDKQLNLLQNGASNAEYHYLGSAKIMTQIGKGFAEAMADLMQK